MRTMTPWFKVPGGKTFVDVDRVEMLEPSYANPESETRMYLRDRIQPILVPMPVRELQTELQQTQLAWAAEERELARENA